MPEMQSSPTIAVIGGKLQGTEAVYLARKAGFRTLLIDRHPDVPAAALCDRLLVFDFGADGVYPPDAGRPDLILPALEDDAVHCLARRWAQAEDIPLAFDLNAYGVSCSKLASDRLFHRLGLPAPTPWPEAGFPVVVKPDNASGSDGVVIIKSPEDMTARFPDGRGLTGMVAQEYVEGPSYSIEVIGTPGAYTPLQVTDLGMDEAYDCNAVRTPTDLSPDQVKHLENMAVAIAETIDLKGIMDLEAILHQGQLKLLEIDARLPSQTPMAVFWSTGMNMVAMLADLFIKDIKPERGRSEVPVLVEHIRVTGQNIAFLGEHIMAGDGPLHIETGFFGADEAVTSWGPGKHTWVATLIFRAETTDALEDRRRNCHHNIRVEQERIQ